jgi:hypothetical protein
MRQIILLYIGHIMLQHSLIPGLLLVSLTLYGCAADQNNAAARSDTGKTTASGKQQSRITGVNKPQDLKLLASDILKTKSMTLNPMVPFRTPTAITAIK